ncbi:ATPase domain-containing protein [Methanohalophilus portucalensis]|uniref:Circadian clock protein KaiC n=2 Tax=Methanohalophilus portucalensis TaxID=39664 RepID=A0A1L9C1K7_9EURY|nr:ATPase domain-containing protein [Methanohalophilus portucalensis]ATU09119.1 circadian clock protein KaiC [Methanohalophilus portucalensis]OJH48419.1 circadian clock protein, KaiC [Methanohalophilus portucalensis FDF-1]RNI08564.1 circadian clock protein KaiC [Methanohalophilus portucalensis FDF-1]SMH44807.1 RecA-superfamily ATPase, KaiC/GvpD/RAD55 family [Methanohalophilus portucalensis FDF-1]
MFTGAENISTEDEGNRVKTGIPGFDELCGGGLVRDRSYLVSGTSGAGKTIFSTQYIYNGITQYGENGIIVATEERPEQIRENMMRFGWDLQALEEENKLAIIDACSTKIGIPSQEKYVDVRPFDIRSMMDQIIATQEEIDAKRALIDSTTSISFYLHEAARIRVELLKLSTTLEIIGLTSLMTCEIVDENQPSRFGVENFVTDGTFSLYYDMRDNVRSRSVEIYKMRGSDHSKKVHPYEVTKEGFVIHPHEEVYTHF